LYHVQQVEPVIEEKSKEKLEENHVVMAARTIRDVAISITTNITSSIRKQPPTCKFELKQNMVVHILPHEDPQVHILNFLEISDNHILTVVSSDYVRLTILPFSLLGESGW